MANELKEQEDIDTFVGLFSMIKEYGADKTVFILNQFSPSMFTLIKQACNKMPNTQIAALMKA
jgi:hypothetical protein